MAVGALRGRFFSLPSALDCLSLFKLRIVLLLLFISGMMALVAAGGVPAGESLVRLLLAGSLASMGAAALNNYLDRDVDALMERTRQRPLPAGRVRRPALVLVLGIGLLLLSLPIALGLNPWVALFSLGGAVVYVVVYTWWLKRRSPWNVVLGGGAGSCAVLAGWTALAPLTSPLPYIVAFLVFLWTPLHFWNFALVHQADYTRAGIPMLPVKAGVAKAAGLIAISAGALFALSLVPYFAGYFGSIYLLAALGSGVLLWGNVRLLRHPNARLAWQNYKLSGVYLALLFLAMAVGTLV